MGEMVSMQIKNFDFMSYKNHFGDLLYPFSMQDLQISDVFDEDGETYLRRFFSISVSELRRRLDCLGHTQEVARDHFERSKKEYMEFFSSSWSNSLWPWSLEEYTSKHTFENWRKAAGKYAHLLANDDYYSRHEWIAEERKLNLSVSEQVVLFSLPFGSDFFGISPEDGDWWSVLRVLLDFIDDDDMVVVDYTNLYEGGWCEEFPSDEDWCDSKTIILTEGKFDAEVLNKSLSLLYPYMGKFYSFLDFSSYSVQGSTNFLTHYLKAFIAAGIKNQVIALYDNDSAGLAELEGLRSIRCPNNFKIMHLPDIEIAKHYPTLGPTGKEIMNINGKACSIEMFLGEDVLKDPEGTFFPVHWKGFVEKTDTYQGEVIRKQDIQKRFRDKLETANQQGAIDLEEWREMNILLKAIFSAFR